MKPVNLQDVLAVAAVLAHENSPATQFRRLTDFTNAAKAADQERLQNGRCWFGDGSMSGAVADLPRVPPSFSDPAFCDALAAVAIWAGQLARERRRNDG